MRLILHPHTIRNKRTTLPNYNTTSKHSGPLNCVTIYDVIVYLLLLVRYICIDDQGFPSEQRWQMDFEGI